MSIKKFLVITISIASILLLASCQKENKAEIAETLVKGRMESVYRGEASEDYMNITGTDLDQIQSAYEANIRREALAFCNYTGILVNGDDAAYEALPEETRKALEDMCSRVYSQAVYEVRDPEEDSEGTYSVELVITPSDAFKEALPRIEAGDYEPYKEFVNQYNTTDTGKETFSSDLANVLIQLIDETMTQGSKATPITYVVTVSGEGDSYSIDANDWAEIDRSMILF